MRLRAERVGRGDVDDRPAAPAASMARSSCFMQRKIDRRFTAMMRSKTSSSTSASGTAPPSMAAALTAQSSPPKSPTARATRASTAAASDTSVATKTAATAVLPDLLDRLPPGVLREVGRHDGRAGGRERERDRAPHAPGRAGHDGDLPVEPGGHRITAGGRRPARPVSTASSRRRRGTCSPSCCGPRREASITATAATSSTVFGRLIADSWAEHRDHGVVAPDAHRHRRVGTGLAHDVGLDDAGQDGVDRDAERADLAAPPP